MISHGYLVHHGIIGQKWGVRRYQNADGSLTEAGKNRRNQSVYTAKDLSKKYDLLDNRMYNDNDKRQRDAAILGLKALNEDPNSSQNRDWFMTEDQTIGYGTVSDMINRGISKKELMNVIRKASELNKNDEEGAPGIFELSEFSRSNNSDFIDNCYKFKNNREAFR